MNKYELVEYADSLLKTAFYKVQDWSECEDLVQETLVAALAALERGEIIDNPKAYLTTVLNRKYYDKLRQKYRKPVTSMDVVPDLIYEEEGYRRLEQSEDAENIRRCLANLTKLYREVMVRYYMHGESVQQIAVALGISQSAVKSRLDTGRKHMRKEFTMEKYEQQSYEPEHLWIGISGRFGINDEPFSLVQNNKIPMNLLILAYKKPVTIPELAKAIGISTTYIEPIIEKLVAGELMERVADKVYTNFIIYTEQDRIASFAQEELLADKLYEKIWTMMEQGLAELRQQDFYQTQRPTQQQKLESYFAVRTMQLATIRVRDEVSGESLSFEQYPDRPNGGKWFAFGNRYPLHYQPTCDYQNYEISGECGNWIDNCFELKRLGMFEYNCALGKTHRAYLNGSDGIPYQMEHVDVMKMLYAIHSGKEKDLPLINMHCLENIEGFMNLHFLAKDENGKIINDVPVITKKNQLKLYELSEKYNTQITEAFHEDFLALMKNPVELPPHLKSVPKWLRYMFCCAAFPMLVIMRAQKAGLFLPDADIENHPIPAIYLTVEK